MLTKEEQARLDSLKAIKAQQDQKKPVTDKFGDYFTPKDVDLSGFSKQDEERLKQLKAIKAAQGSVFESEVREANLPKLSPTMKNASNFNDLITFGAAPYIEASGDFLGDVASGDPSSYKSSLLNRQLQHEAAQDTGFELAKLARDVSMPAKSVAQRILIPGATSALEKAGEVDLTTKEGISDVLNAGATGMGFAGAVEKGKDVLNFLLSKGVKKQPFTQRELIERYVLSKSRKTPGDLDNVMKNRELLSSYADEGFENVEKRLGKRVSEFKDPEFQDTSLTINPIKDGKNIIQEGVDDIVSSQTTSRGVNMMDDPAMGKILSKVKEGSAPVKIGEVFDPTTLSLENVITENMSPKDLSLFYTKIDNAANYAGANGLADVEAKAVVLRNKIKDILREYASPDGQWLKNDKAFTKLQELQPYLDDIRSADIKSRTKAKPTDLIKGANVPFVSGLNPRGLVQMTANAGRQIMESPYQYADELSEQIGRNAPDPQRLLNLPTDQFTQETMVKPGVETFGRGVGRVLRSAGPAFNRLNNPDQTSIERFRDIYEKVPQMGPYKQELEKAMESGKLPLVHFYLMKTDPQYQQLFNSEE